MNIRSASLMALCLCAASQTYAQDGHSCAFSIPTPLSGTFTVDTTGGTNWIDTYGSFASPSNDIMYTFTTRQKPPTGSITPTAANYPFAIYLLSDCLNGGTEAMPISQTTTVGTPLDLSRAEAAHTYYVAITGIPSGGPGANGTLTIDVTPVLPVTLQSFTVD
jgi:hypothetical protein